MLTYLILASALACLHSASAATSNPPWKKWSYCKKSDPKLSECIVKAIQDVEKDIVDGSSYFGLPKLNPLRIEELSLYQAGSDKAVAVNITFTNCEINGLLGWQLGNAKADWDNGELKGVMKFKDQVVFDADYTVDGKIILLPVKGNGKSKIVFDQMEADLAIKGKPITRKGKTYFNVDTFNVNIRPKSATFRFANILNSNAALSDSINRSLTENWKEVLEEVKVPIGQGLGAAFKQMSNRIFAKIPYNVLVPN